MMRISISAFTLELTLTSVFIRLPFIGQAHLDARQRVALWDSWGVNPGPKGANAPEG